MKALDQYKHVHWLSNFGTFQARLVHNGVIYPMMEDKNQHKCAYAILYAHKQLGLDKPHDVQLTFTAQEKEAIEKIVNDVLTTKRLVAKKEVKEKAKS